MKITSRNFKNFDIRYLDKYNITSRAILLDNNNDILVIKYADLFMLPGGKVETRERHD